MALAGAAPASATDVGVDGTILRIDDRAGDPNVLDVRVGALAYDVYDDYSRLTPGRSCIAVGVHRVTCPTVPIAGVSVNAGGRRDAVLLREVTVPVDVEGGAGDDLVEGGSNRDRLVGGSGNDSVLGGAGNDDLSGAGGSDLMEGGDGGDRLAGDAGADVLRGGSGGDRLSGGADDGGRDLLDGGRGDDILKGGPGADVLVTGAGRDSVDTGTGEDRVFAQVGDTLATCSPDDSVRILGAPTAGPAGGLRPDGCTRLPGAERVPDAWPPPPVDGAADASAPPGATVLAARLRRDTARVASSGSPRRLKVHLYASVLLLRVSVCLTTLDERSKPVRVFGAVVPTQRDRMVDIRGPRRTVRTARVVRRTSARGRAGKLRPCRR